MPLSAEPSFSNLKKPKRLAACVSVIFLKATRSRNTTYSQYYISKPLKVKKKKTQNKTKQLHHRLLDWPFLYLNFPIRNYGYGTGSRYLLSTINFYGKGIVSRITP